MQARRSLRQNSLRRLISSSPLCFSSLESRLKVLNSCYWSTCWIYCCYSTSNFSFMDLKQKILLQTSTANASKISNAIFAVKEVASAKGTKMRCFMASLKGQPIVRFFCIEDTSCSILDKLFSRVKYSRPLCNLCAIFEVKMCFCKLK